MTEQGAAQVLRAKEQELQSELAQLTRKADDSGSISFGKRVGDGTSLAVDRLTAVTVQEKLLATLDQVRTSLARIDDETYGTCTVCGGPIGEARLEARPWALRCVADA